MKKVISLMLVLTLSLTLSACGANKKEVKDAILNKRWLGSAEVDDGGYWEYIITFKNDDTVRVCRYTGGKGEFITSGTDISYNPGETSSKEWNGTYEIKNDKIIISVSSGDFQINYTLKDGEISMVLDDGVYEIPLHVMTGV